MYDHKVVVRYADGSMIKGNAQLFFATDETLDLFDEKGKYQIVELDNVKAIFFVRTFEGHDHRPPPRPIKWSPTQGEVVRVTFRDDEVIVGKASRLDDGAPGFFLHPLDPNDNNTNIFVNRRYVRKIEVG